MPPSSTFASTQPAALSAAVASRIVIVDDEPLNILPLAEFLLSAGYEHVVGLSSAEATHQTLRDERADLVLLELSTADEASFELLRQMQADRHLRHVPVLALMTQDDQRQRLRALALGVADVLRKPVHPEELSLRLRNILAAKAHRDQLAHTDPLTGLPNRDSLLSRTDWALKQALRHGTVGAVLHIGLDRFAHVNNALGPMVGDELLHAVSERLVGGMRDSDMVIRNSGARLQPNDCGDDVHTSAAILARGSGDEFSVLLPQLERPEDAAVVAQRMIDSLDQPFQIAGHELFVTCRIGMAVFPGDSADKDAVLQHASVAMRSARREGASEGCAFQYYSAALNSQAVRRLSLERELRQALERGEFRLHYQPQVCLAQNRLFGAEALVRWLHPVRGLLSPAEFVAVAEETGLIGALGEWVLNEALRQWAAWRDAGWRLPQIAVNVSGLQLQQTGLAGKVRAALQSSGADPQALCLELTETAIIDGNAQVTQTLQAIRQMGVRLALDDFGTGYSSLTYLRRFEIDELKIDRSFVADCEGDSSNAAITAAIVVMARRLGLRVVAEGVETLAQLNFIRAQGADSFQGYLFSKPLPADQFSALLGAPEAQLRGLLPSPQPAPARAWGEAVLA
jgi:diguanylate cyclase